MENEIPPEVQWEGYFLAAKMAVKTKNIEKAKEVYLRLQLSLPENMQHLIKQKEDALKLLLDFLGTDTVGVLLSPPGEIEKVTQEFVLPPEAAFRAAEKKIKELGDARKFNTTDDLVAELKNMFPAPVLSEKNNPKHFPKYIMPIRFNGSKHNIELRFNPTSDSSSMSPVFFDKISNQE